MYPIGQIAHPTKTINLKRKSESVGCTIVDDLVNPESGEIIIEGMTVINENTIKVLRLLGY